MAFENLTGSHTGEYLAQTVLDVLHRYDIRDRLGCITTDNASNNITMAKELQRKLRNIGTEWDASTSHIPCMAHVVNLCVQRFMSATSEKAKELEEDQVSPIKVILEKIRSIARAHRAGQLRREKWVQCCQHNGLPPLMIPTDVTVRWNSTYHMLERALYLRQAIERYCFEMRKELPDSNLTDEEWELAEILLLILYPFKRCTKRFESDLAKSEITYVFFAYDTLYDHVDDMKDTFADEALQNVLPWATYLLDAVNAMEDILRKYYARTSLPTVYGDAMILNPRYKLTIFDKESWESEDPAPYVEGCRRRFNQFYNHQSTQSSIPSDELDEPSKRATSVNGQKTITTVSEDKEYLHAMRKRSRTSLTNEFDNYIQAPPDPEIDSPLAWWKSHEDRYPKMAQMARDILSVPASGSGVERQFSVTGRLATWQRHRLAPKNVSNSMIYKAHLAATKFKPIKGDDGQTYDLDEADAEESIPMLVDNVMPPEWADGWYYQKTKGKDADEVVERNFRIAVDEVLDRRAEVDDDIYG